MSRIYREKSRQQGLNYVLTKFPECIGTCDWCGAIDHHLDEGLCPVCRPKAVSIGRRQEDLCDALDRLTTAETATPIGAKP